jgi:hypothetical protein
MAQEKIVNIKLLKQFALENLPKKSTLRDIILSEPDQIKASDFIIKMDLWIRLLNLEEGK